MSAREAMGEHPYLRVKEDILAGIADGLYPPHSKLPSQRDLGVDHGVSHMTVRRAINELVRDGAIYTRAGSGLYVAEPKVDAEAGPLIGFTEDMARRGMRASSRLLECSMVSASTVLATTLRVVVGQPLVCVRRLRLAEDEPMALQTNYLPAALCPGLPAKDLEGGSLFEILKSDYGLRLVDAETAVSAELASEAEAGLLHLEPPASLLVTEQITYLDNDQPIEFVRSLYRGDRYRLRVERRKPSPRPR